MGWILGSLGSMLLVADTVPASIPELPEYVRIVTGAIANRAPETLRGSFAKIGYFDDGYVREIDASAFVEMFAACTLVTARRFSGSIYRADYRCSGPKEDPSICTTFGFYLTVDERTIQAKRRRELTPQCSAAAPPPPLFTGDDYPREALEKGWEGDVIADLAIDKHGRVTACKKSSKPAAMKFSIAELATSYVCALTSRRLAMRTEMRSKMRFDLLLSDGGCPRPRRQCRPYRQIQP